jgi:hypothetical protein
VVAASNATPGSSSSIFMRVTPLLRLQMSFSQAQPFFIPNEMSIVKLEAREYHLNGLSSPPLFVRVVLRIRVATAKQW